MIVLEVLEFNAESVREWESLSACAEHHHVTPEMIKRLICSGGTLDGRTTFDICPWCAADIKEDRGRCIVYSTIRIARHKSPRSVSHAVHQGSLCLPNGVVV
jgi:hypothetical protein